MIDSLQLTLSGNDEVIRVIRMACAEQRRIQFNLGDILHGDVVILSYEITEGVNPSIAATMVPCASTVSAGIPRREAIGPNGEVAIVYGEFRLGKGWKYADEPTGSRSGS